MLNPDEEIEHAFPDLGSGPPCGTVKRTEELKKGKWDDSVFINNKHRKQ